MKEQDKKKAAESLIGDAAKCETPMKLSDVTKTIVVAFGICEEASPVYKKAVSVLTAAEPTLYREMMAEVSSVIFSNLLLQADPENGMKAIQRATCEGDVGVTPEVKKGARA